MSPFTNYIDPIPALKAQLADVLVQRLDGLSTMQASASVGLQRQRIGDIRAGRLDDFSLQRLVRLLHRLGDRIAIEVTPAAEARLAEARQERARQSAMITADWERRRRLAEKRRIARRAAGSALERQGSDPGRSGR